MSNCTVSPVLPERLIFLHALFYASALLLPTKTWRSVYIKGFYVISTFFIFVETAYALIYKDTITTSIAYILLETNFSEAKGYLSIYLNWQILILFLVYLIPSIFIFKGVRWLLNNKNKSSTWDINEGIKTEQTKIPSFLKNHEKRIKKSFLFLFASLGTIIYINAHHFEHHVLNKIITGIEMYKKESRQYADFIANSKESKFLNSVVKQADSSRKTLIFLIGEASTRSHFGIYGYYRNTTPGLEAMSGQLAVFRDVISPFNSTIPSLENVLTFASVSNPEDIRQGSIVQLVKNAGFKTFWISNQIPLGLYETLVTMIGKTADQSFFINMGSAEVQHSYDENLFPFIEKALEDKAAKKVIFVHILGTHSLYDLRYPKEYQVFTDKPQTKFPSSKSHEVINQYDNAVLYNDFVVSQIITILNEHAQTEEEQHLIYFSDHGEEVYQTMNFEGHADAIASQPMFEIPFIYWSNQSEKVQEYQGYTNRAYVSDNLIYSVADVLNISFGGMTPEKSIFSAAFIAKPRMVKNGQDYDKLFSQKNENTSLELIK
ncbi:MAG: sulfatase-like hydrolase/transferase [Bacteroidia bacterium]|nr:sulfatase-like hydrolase/transferase [Bacteroidota bacterium]MCZ2130306.1 sulfatase-like hydrolase/transferase [Bacteroidia bacterium]